MTARTLATTTVAVAAAAALGACGSTAGGGKQSNPAAGAAPTPSAAPNPSDKRGVALRCITDKGLSARLVGAQSIQVGAPTGPRIEVFVSGGEAEGQQFQGNAQGAEQIGSALLFLNQGSPDVLSKLEDCLDNQ